MGFFQRDPYPLHPIPTFFRVSCRPSTKKGGIYHGKPGFQKNTLEKAGIWSKGYGCNMGVSDQADEPCSHCLVEHEFDLLNHADLPEMDVAQNYIAGVT